MSYFIKAIRYELIKKKIKNNNPFQYQKNIKTEKPEKPVIYLFFVACGTNMGDHAIVKAEKEYFYSVLGENISIVEIQTRQTENAIDIVKKNIRKQDLIVLSGGGYIGDEYIEVYRPLLRIMKKFRYNKIIIFPQTIFFHSMRHEKNFIKFCKRIDKLQIFVREKKSQEIFSKYGISTELVPDIVLSQTPIKHLSTDKSDILMCMRNDVERALDSKEFDVIRDSILDYGNVIITDTVEKVTFSQEERFDYLQRMLNKFSNSQLVITDRIHGMIFSYLTNTPCIVFGNYNHKVEAEYEWIKQACNIRFLKLVDKELIKNTVTELLEIPDSDNKPFCDEFVSLKKVIIQYYE